LPNEPWREVADALNFLGWGSIVRKQRSVSALRRVLLILLLTVSTLLASIPVSHPVIAQNGNMSGLYVSPGKSSSPNSFTVNVNLTLSSSDTVSGYDIYMSYNSTLLNATGVTLGNLFPPSRVINVTECINDNVVYGSGCSILDSINVVHLDVAYVDGALSGPNSWTVFTVQFSVKPGVTGHGFFTLFGDPVNCGEALSQGCIFSAVTSSGFPVTVIHLTWDGVYSNDGLQAFFNVSPALLIVNSPVHFDASYSFNPKNPNDVLSYSWDFGDANLQVGGVTANHPYAVSGNYTVSLTVTNSTGAKSSIHRPVTVESNLGGLRIFIQPTHGSGVNQSVTVRLYNGSSLVGTFIRAAGNTGPFSASGLLTGTYRLDFSGPGITPASKPEPVTAGWTTTDTVYLTVQTPPPVVDLRVYLLLAGILGSVGITAVLIVRTRAMERRAKRAKSARR
jgi:hypothetical protein